jgi:O-antigen/teichoic acid export membrane protein
MDDISNLVNADNKVEVLSTLGKIAQNTYYLTVAEMGTRILGYILVILIARHLGDIAFGQYSFVLAFVSLFAVIADIGLSSLSTRTIAQKPDHFDEYIGNIFTIKLILSLVVLALIVIVVLTSNYSQDVSFAIYIAAIYTIFTSLKDLFISVIRGVQEMKLEMQIKIFEKTLLFALIFALIFLNCSLIGILFAYAISSSCAYIYSYFTSKRFYRLHINFNIVFWKTVILEALPFAITTVLVTVYFQIDTIMLSMMKGDAIVGWYNAAYKIIFTLMFIPGAFVSAIFPVISQHYASNLMESTKKLFLLGIKYLILIAIPITVFGYIFASEIIFLLYGESFTPSVYAFQILVFVVPLLFVTSLLGSTLQALGAQRMVCIIAGINAVINITLNFVIIPYYSYIGASITTVLTELFGVIAMIFYSTRILNIQPLKIGMLRYISVISIFSLTTWVLASFNCIVAFTVGFVVYITLLCTHKILDDQDKAIVEKLFKGGHIYRFFRAVHII